MDLESRFSVGGNHIANRSLNGRSFPQSRKLATLCASLGHGVGLDLDRPVSIIRGEGATYGAEADLEVRYVPSAKPALALQQRGKSG